MDHYGAHMPRSAGRAGPPPPWVGDERLLPWSELDRYDRASIAVDCVLLTVEGRQLHVLVHRRDADPLAGRWALPGGFVRYPEGDDDAVCRVVKEKVGLDIRDVHRERLDWSGEPVRDQRGWVVTHTYLALAPAAVLRRALGSVDPATVALAPVLVPWQGERDEPVFVSFPGVTQLRKGKGAGQQVEHGSLAWDHNQLIGLGVKRLRGKLRYTNVGLEVVPDEFTLRELQAAYEGISGETWSRTSFRKHVLVERAIIEPTGQMEQSRVGHRPAELYRPKE